jgi:hypothetical protein
MRLYSQIAALEKDSGAHPPVPSEAGGEYEGAADGALHRVWTYLVTSIRRRRRCRRRTVFQTKGTTRTLSPFSFASYNDD